MKMQTNKLLAGEERSVNTKKWYEEKRVFFDNLNFQKDHFVNSNDICTPMGCVEEMVNTIPQDFWKKEGLKILDPCAGNGNFHAYITTKVDLKNLWFNEINEKRIGNIKKIFGKSVNVIEKDFLTFANKEEYDLVVANPPYAKFTNGERTAKNHNLSRSFILKALSVTKEGGYILFIVPDNWMSYADNNKVVLTLSNYQFIHLNIHGAKKWFPKVGSSFSWFLLKKTPNRKNFIIDNGYKLKKVEHARLDKNTNFIPLYYSNTVRSIVKKTLCANSEKYPIQTSSFLHKYTKKDQFSTACDSEYKYRTLHTPTQTVWSKIPHVYQKGWKVFLSLTNQYHAFIDSNCGMTQSIAFIQCTSQEEAKKIAEQLKNPLYVFLNNITRYGNFNNIRVLQSFPIFRDFGLTDAETVFIRTFNNEYYGHKKPLL